MTGQSRDERIKQVLTDIDRALPATSPQADRAVEAIRASTPNRVITDLDDRGLLGNMLEGMANRFRGRAIADISTTELVQIARDSADETMGIEPIKRNPQRALVSENSELAAEGEAARFLAQIASVIHSWESGKVGALTAAEQVEKFLHRKADSEH